MFGVSLVQRKKGSQATTLRKVDRILQEVDVLEKGNGR